MVPSHYFSAKYQFTIFWKEIECSTARKLDGVWYIRLMNWWGRFERQQSMYNPVWVNLGTTNCKTNITSKSCKDCPVNVIQNTEMQLQRHFILSSTPSSWRRKDTTNTTYSLHCWNHDERSWMQILLLSLPTLIVENETSQGCEPT